MTSAPFRIPRYLLARLSAEQYVRSFWWFVLVVPIFGIVAMVFSTGLLQVIGMFAILWPVTIPARAILGGWKAGTFFSNGVTLESDDSHLYFHGKDSEGMKLAISAIRKVNLRHGFVLLSFGIGQFVAIPAEALGDQVATFLETLRTHNELLAK